MATSSGNPDILGRLMKAPNYQMCRNISFIISDVYTDIRKNAKILNFIESGKREETISIIHGLNEVCKMWDISCSDAERAISFLSLSSYETRLKSSILYH